MFDPRIGRWLEMDPIAFDAGDANLYRAMGNNPTNATDPSGKIVIIVPGRTDDGRTARDPFGSPDRNRMNWVDKFATALRESPAWKGKEQGIYLFRHRNQMNMLLPPRSTLGGFGGIHDRIEEFLRDPEWRDAIQGLATFITQINTLLPDEPVYLVAHSAGAIVALGALQQVAQRNQKGGGIDGLLLISSAFEGVKQRTGVDKQGNPLSHPDPDRVWGAVTAAAAAFRPGAKLTEAYIGVGGEDIVTGDAISHAVFDLLQRGKLDLRGPTEVGRVNLLQGPFQGTVQGKDPHRDSHAPDIARGYYSTLLVPTRPTAVQAELEKFEDRLEQLPPSSYIERLSPY
jgi:pimeloyl-ACP methyl ester carboxylesterase